MFAWKNRAVIRVQKYPLTRFSPLKYSISMGSSSSSIAEEIVANVHKRISSRVFLKGFTTLEIVALSLGKC